jgi:indolepyruvate ferredoxin oxidoreductase
MSTTDVVRPAGPVSLEDKYTSSSGRALMTGIQALVRLTLEQRRLDRGWGLDTGAYVTGYQGSPLGGVDTEMGRAAAFLGEAGVVFRSGLNEELAATAVNGTQLLHRLPGRRHDGVVGFWYGKNPGLDRAADAIRHGNIAGTAPLGGAVAWIGDDPACKSSTVPSSSEAMARSLMVPLLAPSSVAEILELGLHAVALSRASGLWTALKIVADIADAAATVDFDGVGASITAPDPRRSTVKAGALVGPASLDAERDLVRVRLPRVHDYARAADLNRIVWEPARPRVAVVAGGAAFAAVLRALDDLGVDEVARQRIGLRLVKIGLPWPMEVAELRRLTAGVQEVVVIEEKLSFLESQLKEALYDGPERPRVRGKDLVPADGAVTGDVAARALAAALPEEHVPGARRAARPRIAVLASDGPSRAPFFCSGCPHNISTRAADDVLVGAGIGCHVMVALAPEGRGHLVGITQMGGEGSQWLGLAPFTDDPHFVQNLGDGTFSHSGSLAIRAAVAAGVNVTYKLLYNNAVAMTGGQAVQGGFDVPALTRLLAAEGVKAVVVTTPDPGAYRRVRLDPIARVRHRDDLDTVQAELATVPGVTVIVHDDRCAAEERRLRKRGALPAPAERVWINARVCEGCGDCGEASSCLSVVPVPTPFGRKTTIHQGSCNQDLSCLKGNCPSFVVVTPGRSRPVAAPAPPDLPEPSHRATGDALIRMCGIGGTGVVTVSQLLQMAAHLDGAYSAGLDQTGLAQKGGPVVSDVRLSGAPIDAAVNATESSVDVLLVFDLIGATSASTLDTLEAGRTVAVVNTAIAATAAMITDPAEPLPDVTALIGRIERATAAGNVLVDAQHIAERVVGDHLLTNMVVVGAAYQRGLLPLTADAIESAIELNGATVERNVLAFRWGRAAEAFPDVIPAAAPDGPVLHPAAARLLADRHVPTDLRGLLIPFVSELIGYQSVAYARRYVDEVKAVEGRRPGRSIVEAYARNLFKLMAYKDEYEVARLHLDPVERARLAGEFGAGATTRIMLHPPVLKALGLRRKIHLGPATEPALRVLRGLRRVRGTALDPFGRTETRRVERALPTEYRALVHDALDHLTPANKATALEIVELPDLVRGYEEVKAAAVASYRQRSGALLRTMRP